MANGTMMRGGIVALVLAALSACGAPPPSNEASGNNVALAPEEVLAETNETIIHGGNAARGDAGTDVSPPARDGTEAPSAPTATVPARFHGRWDSTREACARASSEMRLVVAANSLRFYESVGQVIAARATGDAVAVNLRTTGEGETRSETRTLRLDDGRLVVESGGTSATRVRCPA